MTGWVYVMSNPAMPGLLKIGMSSQDPKIHRVKELSQTTSVPKPFSVEYQILVEDESSAETLLHQLFRNHRLENREFFDGVTVSQIVQSARHHLEILLEEFPLLNAEQVALELEQATAAQKVEELASRKQAWLWKVRRQGTELEQRDRSARVRHRETVFLRKIFTLGLYKGKPYDNRFLTAEEHYIAKLSEMSDHDIKESFNDRNAPLSDRMENLKRMTPRHLQSSSILVTRRRL